MRRVYTAAVAAALLIVPAVTRAQAAPQTYVVRGCFTGVLNYAVSGMTFTPTFGTIACVSGTAVLAVALPATPGVGSPSAYAIMGSLVPQFNPDFTGTGLGSDARPSISLTTAGGRTLNTDVGPFGFFPGVTTPFSGFIPGDTSVPPSAFTAGQLSGAFTYALPSRPPGDAFDYATGVLTLTATPEPATLALTFAGLAVVGMGVRTRRATRRRLG